MLLPRLRSFLLIVSLPSAIWAQSAQTPACADLHLVPAPRECSAVDRTSLRGVEASSRAALAVRIATKEADTEDVRFAAKDLEDWLEARGCDGRDRPLSGHRIVTVGLSSHGGYGGLCD